MLALDLNSALLMYVFLPFFNLQSWIGSHASRLISLQLHVANAVPFLQEPFF